MQTETVEKTAKTIIIAVAAFAYLGFIFLNELIGNQFIGFADC
jgi:hypothetical protein